MDSTDLTSEILTQAKDELKAHFSALAIWLTEESTIRWVRAVCNRNNRYQRIRLRLGKGIAGKVIVSGKTMVIQDFQSTKGIDSSEYPILYAEELVTAIGLPIYQGDHVRGVLLIGYRSVTQVTTEQIAIAEKYAVKLGTLLERNHGW